MLVSIVWCRVSTFVDTRSLAEGRKVVLASRDPSAKGFDKIHLIFYGIVDMTAIAEPS